MIEQIKQWVENNRSSILETYHHLHSIAEVSWEEKNTTAYICRELDKMDIPYTTFEDITGVIAIWDGTNDSEGHVTNPTVGLRADLDALWQNVDGVWKANHSCGHDAHMTMVLYTLRCLKEIGFVPKGRLKILFQPAEETGLGANALIDKGVVDDIDTLLGIHLRPIQELSYGQASPAIYHGATTIITGKVIGLQAHGARPHLGINVVDSLAAIIGAVNAVRMNPTIPSSVKVTNVQTGGKNYNIIPDSAEFAIDVRAQTNEAMIILLDKVKKAIQIAGSANGATVELEIMEPMVAAVPNPMMEEVVGQAIIEMLGEDALITPTQSPGAEDFHNYPKRFPQLKATMIGLGTDLSPGLHHPQMSFNLDSLQRGIEILAASTVKIFDKLNSDKGF